MNKFIDENVIFVLIIAFVIYLFIPLGIPELGVYNSIFNDYNFTDKILFILKMVPILFLVRILWNMAISFIKSLRHLVENSDGIGITRQYLYNKVMTRKKETNNKNNNKKKNDSDKIGGNYAFSIFICGDETFYYISHSKEFSIDNVENYYEYGNKKYKICDNLSIVDEVFPVKRLNTNLSFEYPFKERYAERKKNCCERKIMSQIVKDFGYEKLKEGEIIIYTALEPCIYCFEVLKTINENGIKIELYYDDLLEDLKENHKSHSTDIDKIIGITANVA